MTSLLARLLMIVAVALVPVLGFQIYSETQTRTVRLQLIEDEAMRLLRLVSGEQQRIIDGAEQVLDVIAGSPAVQEKMPDLCNRLLMGLLNQTPRYNYAGVIALDGSALCAPTPLNRVSNVSDRSFFRAALESGRFVAGEYTIGRTSREPTIHLAKPARDSKGDIIAVVDVGLSLKWLNDEIGKLDMPAGGIVTVTDRNGTILARRPGGMAFVGQPIPPTGRFTLEGDRVRVASTLTSLDGDRPVIVAYAPPGADPLGISVRVGLDARTTFAGATRANLTGLLLIGAGGLLALLLTAVVGNRLIRRPVARLLDVAERWRNGDLDARTGLPADGSEFARLAAAFEAMAATAKAREHALHATLESTSDVVVSIDRDWRLTYQNAHARARSQGQDYIGRNFWEVYPEVIGTKFERGYRVTMDTGVPTRVKDYYARLDGYFDVHAYPTADGISVFIRDVTEEHRTSAALRDSESRLQLAREAAGFGIWDRDLIAGRLIWSDEQWRLHGLEPRDGGADMDTWAAVLHPDDRERMVSLRQALLTDPETLGDMAYRVVWPDGSIHWLLGKSRVTRDANGVPVRLVGVTLDVTSIRETEAALRRLSAELEARVRQEVAAREAAQARAAQAERMQALGQLAGGIAHDINNVLQGVAGAVAMIQRRAGDEAAARRYGRMAMDAIERGAAVTGRLLTFGRRAGLRTESIDLPALIRGVEEILRYTLGAGIDIRLALPDDLPSVAADKGQLETVLVNLATNARDAMPSGGILTIEATAEAVSGGATPHPAGLAPGAYLRIAVSDTGTGMDPATLARAREPFFTTKKPGAGTGLGLPMAFGFAEQSGGAMTLESEPGSGTRVALWLPQAAAEPPVRAPAAAARPNDMAATILVVDDEDLIREVIARQLDDAGYTTLVASNGHEAVALLDEGELIDAVVSDLAMPGMDGLTLIHTIQGRLPHVPALLLTGYAEDAAALVLGDSTSGRIALARKPISEVRLLDRVGALLAKRTVLAP